MAVTSMANSSIANYNKFNRMDKDSALQAQVASTTGSPTVTTDGSATVYSFTGSGSITVSRAGFAHILTLLAGVLVAGPGLPVVVEPVGCLQYSQAYFGAGTVNCNRAVLVGYWWSTRKRNP
jgi:hypothetical protein